MKDADKALARLEGMSKAILKIRDGDKLTKYQTISFIKQLEKLIEYQRPMPPVEVENDGHLFLCPRCDMWFETEHHVDDFRFCPMCGQRFKENENEE